MTSIPTAVLDGRSRSVLAFGDNLTWGYDVYSGLRLPHADRWTTVLQSALAGDVDVIPEGLAGRTTAFDDHTGVPDRNGARILPTILATHSPLDVVVLMLGNSELRSYVANAIGAAHGMRRLIEIVRTQPNALAPAPEIVVVAPPRLVDTTHPDLKPMFEGAIEQSMRLADYLRRIAGEAGTDYFDAETVVAMSPVDGAHLDAASTRSLGLALVPIVQSALARRDVRPA